MNKEELYIITDQSREQLDLLSPSGITLKWVSNLFNDISKLTCSYSYTFKLPMTANNRRVLDLADDIRHENTMMKKYFRAEFLVNGIDLCPNARLYISEMADSFSCVMTWRVLEAFETLKSEGSKLHELPSLGSIVWGGNEQYGGVDSNTSNLDKVVYPDYDAGVPHMTNTPPKPCVPVYKIIQMINDTYGVKFDIGKLIASGMGMKPRRYLNNPNYYNRRVYDDFVSNGVIPLVNSQINNAKFSVRGIFSTGTHDMLYKYLIATEKWSMAEYGNGSSSSPLYAIFYQVIEGTYTSLSPFVSAQLAAVYQAPTLLAVGIPVLSEFRGNEYVKPLYAFQHNSGLWFFNAKKSGKAEVDRRIGLNVQPARWGTRTYTMVEHIVDSLGTTPQSKWGQQHSAQCIENNTRWSVYSNDQGPESGKNVGVIGIYTRQAFSIKGSCDLRIAKSAVTAGRVSIGSYKWICIAAVNVKRKDRVEGEISEYGRFDEEFEIEPVTEKSISSAAGFQSIDVPKYDAATDSYICHFEFGSEYDVRKIEVDANDDEDFKGYVFLPYFPEDHTIEVSVTDEDGNTDTVERLNLQEGDFVIDNLVITDISPDVDVSVLPTKLKITESLPEISCFDFMKSVFYMNGAMPRVERDGETITAMYYNQLRDRVNDNMVLDWSGKLLSADMDPAKSAKFHNTKYSKNNYFEMSKSNRGKTEEEILEDFDQYSDGYGNIEIDDDTLKEEASVYKSPFAPAFIQNLRYPLVKVGNTCKVWEGDNTLESRVSAIYGYMVFRTYEPKYEDTRVHRPQNSDITLMHKRMNIFSPFDNEELMQDLFGYLKAMLSDYQLVKEKFLLNELDLRDFDESMPVYLSKYNAYFAVSSIQRDKEGVSTVELIKLPRVDSSIGGLDESYSVEMLSTGSVTVRHNFNSTAYKVYIKRTENSAWEEVTNGTIEFGEDGIYAIAGEGDKSLYVYCTANGRYRFTYYDIDTDADKDFIKAEASVYFDGKDWSDCVSKDINGNKTDYVTIDKADLVWHRVEIVIPIRNQFDEVVETRRWTSPIIVASRGAMEGYDAEGNRTVITCSSIGSLHVDLVRDYTSNQTAIYSSLGMGAYDGNCNIGLEAPIWARPYEGERLKGDSYTLRLGVYESVPYKVLKYKNGILQSNVSLSTKVRVYWDDDRVPSTTTKTLYRSEFGGSHIIKYECVLTDEDGTVLLRVHRRVIWFVTTVNQSVIDSPYGITHDEDATIKVNDVNISGNASISDTKDYAYTLNYLPSYADIKASSVTVTAINTNEAAIEVVSQSLEGFVIRATRLPEEESDVTVQVEVTLADGTTFTKQKLIALMQPYIFIPEDMSFVANNGSGSKVFSVYVYPNPTTQDKLISVASSNPLIGVSVNTSARQFTLSASSITQNETTTITVVCERAGIQLSKTFEVTAEFRNVWSTDILDQEGVLIVDRNGMFYTADEWRKSGIENADADGIAVSDGTHRFVVAKNDCGSRAWGSSSLAVTGIVTTTSVSDALTDYNGKANTDAIINQDSNAVAARYARKTENFPSGKAGYLGAAGEWDIYYRFSSLIDTLMKVIEGSVINRFTMGQEDRWTSTQRTTETAWYYHFGSDNTVESNNKTYGKLVRPFAELTILLAPVVRGSFVIQGPDTFQVVNGSGSARYSLVYSPSGVTISDVSVTSNNSDVKVRLISNSEIEVYVENAIIDEVATITVRARLNGLMETVTRNVTAIGETVVDFTKLDEAHALIIDKEYNFYDEEEWYESGKLMTDANGIAVSDGTHRLVIALHDMSSRCRWGGRNVVIDGLTKGFGGLENTRKIMAAVTKSDGYFTNSPYSAAGYVNEYTFPNGEKGFLGSRAEWLMVLSYLNEVEALLSAVGGDSLIKTTSYTYWTSSSDDEIRAYCAHIYTSSYDGELHTGTDTRYRSDSSYVRPFHQF